MTPGRFLAGALRRAARLPLIKQWRAWEIQRDFAHREHCNLFNGVYGSFAEALAAAPDTKPLGYDQPEPAAMYRDRLDQVYPTDYPVLFWLDRIFRAAEAGAAFRVFDFGGHVGVGYHAYRRYLAYPAGLTWTVCDVPAVAEAGAALAAERGAAPLRFTSSVADGDGADLFFASGSLQYVEASLAEMLGGFDRRPAHVIVNLTPLHDAFEFVTLQNIGPVFCPYKIFNKGRFLEELAALGYDLVDLWENAEKACDLPLTPERSVRPYLGAYLRERSS